MSAIDPLLGLIRESAREAAREAVPLLLREILPALAPPAQAPMPLSAE